MIWDNFCAIWMRNFYRISLKVSTYFQGSFNIEVKVPFDLTKLKIWEGIDNFVMKIIISMFNDMKHNANSGSLYTFKGLSFNWHQPFLANKIYLLWHPFTNWQTILLFPSWNISTLDRWYSKRSNCFFPILCISR